MQTIPSATATLLLTTFFSLILNLHLCQHIHAEFYPKPWYGHVPETSTVLSGVSSVAVMIQDFYLLEKWSRLN
jgi:hypothetical protein